MKDHTMANIVARNERWEGLDMALLDIMMYGIDFHGDDGCTVN
jgi:hypothetical protein